MAKNLKKIVFIIFICIIEIKRPFISKLLSVFNMTDTDRLWIRLEKQIKSDFFASKSE